ncbi:L-sorbosone dehydrogenase [Chimaeribacter arupi]|uniref:L-sorbosone dehydrogenase n=2 Tax=Yersiniaceae TaxID=1903411 RepID=A0A2N5EQZ9_9GAMM|nr:MULTISPECIES: sorbosone dehydrogenase family protein [Yersiniaceae]MBS0970961.1 sorbosone dehydrogenase family protein [Nissabacter archeti]MDV5139103.1 sorbosone dehydrogenase family protein [Chimaeribacter arupi]PLR29903.1 L-sorbosone dehydrogenase [Chimaeribacter arupi]PLR43705.1 L-sorbosone dehydrogenase [Chimaeribacter arupi]PLR45378.1 L-sorbosone dehydrogenase [Chimaeribacter arupi]
MSNLRTLSLLALSVILAGCDDGGTLDPNKQVGPDPQLPEAKNFLLPPMQVPSGVSWKAGETPKVPAGLKIERVAEGLMHPRQLYVLPNNDVLVVEANGPSKTPNRPKQLIMGVVQQSSGKGGPGGNRITLLRNNNGTWEKHIFLEHLYSPFGVQLIGNTLYVANADAIRKYPYTPGATQITDPGEELADLPGGPINHHWTKALLASPDGTKLYAGIGSNSNITENGLGNEYRRAAVLEVDVASGASRIYASGLRNPTGLQWEPQTGKLWAIVNERDEIGADLVPDYMTSVQEGGFYGWPYSYFGQHIDQRVRPQRPDLVEKAIKPDYALSSHVAPLGLLFYTGTNLPAEYRGGAFVSEHGSWNRKPLNGYRVSWVAFRDGKPVGEPKPVVTGFLTDDQKEVRGLPVGLAQDQQGGLLIADDAGNIVWRVSAAGTP